ncbi:AraC family transcriptional regulator [Pararobbsia silviterrae]|uniref:AraC family transcriptional regulator n=1 Tax=Pararobbsia silviterrae TaxID=1792498 RepID=A0A494XW63_9BURK|nr:helix-turn-helix transcriptional regulator [Pararobbsia silviterrae]RKP51833.1 AraC family transcriptional regulator [Pararobbsia silviterrae]
MKDFLLKRYPHERRHLPRQVTVWSIQYNDNQRELWHQHEHGHLVIALSGVVRVLTPNRTWTLPPSRALWIPSNVDHELHAVGRLHLCVVNIDPGAASWLWQAGRVITVEPLMRELVTGMLRDGRTYEADSRTALSVPLLLKMLEEAPSLGEGGLPLPRDTRLLALCEHMMTDPATDYTLDRWADEIGMSTRSLARHFRDETGMSFGHWRQHMRAAEATTRLALGAQVTQVALELGYSTPSAFTVMFRRLFGASPQQYMSADLGR